jgi:hypothetical protein
LSLFIRFFVVIFAFWLASLAAGATLVLGAVAPAADVPTGSHMAPVLWILVLTTGTFVAFFSFAPAVIVILLAESFAWRSVVIYAVAGGTIGLFCGVTYGFLDWSPGPRLDLPLDGNTELVAGAGIAAGIVYWLVAGRNAGAWRSVPASQTRP